MTAPQSQDPQAPPPESTVAQDAETIAGFLAASAAVGAGFAAAETARAAIVHTLTRHGATRLQAKLLMSIEAQRPVTPAVPLSPTAAASYNSGPDYRARYLLNAARRLVTATAVSAGQAAGDVVGVAVPGTPLGDAVGKERRYFAQHAAAQTAREQAALRLDAATGAYGPTLGWYARDDERTTAECRDADGKNFLPARPPLIGLPGALGPHNGCRCVPGPPHAHGALMIPAPRSGSIAASEARMAIELAAKGKSGTLPNGMKVEGDGQTYDPKTKSFHPTTDAEKNQAAAKGGDFNSKHPRAGAGSPQGGQFVPLGQARGQEAGQAQTALKGDQATQDRYRQIQGMKLADQVKLAHGLNMTDLQHLAQLLYSAKSSDPKIVSSRIAVANELAKRGVDVHQLWGIRASGNVKPATKAAPKAKATKARGKTLPAGAKGLKQGPKGEVVLDDSVSDAQVAALKAAGWKGNPADHREALYPPVSLSSRNGAIEMSAQTCRFCPKTATKSTSAGGKGIPTCGPHAAVAKAKIRMGDAKSQPTTKPFGATKAPPFGAKPAGKPAGKKPNPFAKKSTSLAHADPFTRALLMAVRIQQAINLSQY